MVPWFLVNVFTPGVAHNFVMYDVQISDSKQHTVNLLSVGLIPEYGNRAFLRNACTHIPNRKEIWHSIMT